MKSPLNEKSLELFRVYAQLQKRLPEPKVSMKRSYTFTGFKDYMLVFECIFVEGIYFLEISENTGRKVCQTNAYQNVVKNLVKLVVLVIR